MNNLRRPGKIEEPAEPINQKQERDNVHTHKHSEKHTESNRRSGAVDEATEILEAELHKTTEFENNDIPENNSLNALLSWSFSLALFVWLGYLLYTTLRQVWITEPLWLSSLLLLATGACAGFFSIIIFRQVKSIRTVNHLEILKKELFMAEKSNDIRTVKRLMKPVLANLSRQNPALVNKFEIASESRNTVTSYLDLFDNIVLFKIDQHVEKIIQRESLLTAAAVAASPHPVLDAFIALWRSLSMSQKISIAYGIKFTGFGALVAFKKSIVNAATAGTTEVVTARLNDAMISSSFAGILKPLGEAAVIGWRFYHLGNRMKGLCRLRESSDT